MAQHRRASGNAPFALITLLSKVLLLPFVLAECECGYSDVVGSAGETYVFTDLVETDFTSINQISLDTDWQRQAFNVSANQSRGEYGEMMAVNNVVTTSAGLELTVRSSIVDDMVSTAEIDTTRLDLLWGTFRASMKLTSIAGTCAAFFWFRDNYSEIDMEVLSSEFNPANNTYPINLVLQSEAAAQAGFNAQGTPTFQKVNLPFDPTADFHEYRFDFLPGRVFFYADGQVLAKLGGPAVPDQGGHLILQHWSNGNAKWSSGPPAKDATLTVAYVKAYFNSSTSQRQDDWAARCTNASSPGAVCAVPKLTPTNTSSSGFFFTGQQNMTNNQTVYNQSASSDNGSGTAGDGNNTNGTQANGDNENGAVGFQGRMVPLLCMALLVGGWAAGLW